MLGFMCDLPSWGQAMVFAAILFVTWRYLGRDDVRVSALSMAGIAFLVAWVAIANTDRCLWVW